MAKTNSASTKLSPKELEQQKAMLCDGLSFGAAEAYKLLRTNLLFAMPDKPCRIIGITSSVRGEGKSTTSVNLSYTFAQSGKRVLLIDADLRLPSIASKLNIPSKPGLSNLLAGLNNEKSCLMISEYFDNWYILPAGDIPPNPSELLGSERMHALLERYTKFFDYIIIDLPPIDLVADALVISPWTDGLVLAVRQNYAERKALNSCMYQVKKVGAKFLGFVMTDAPVTESSYRRYGKYGGHYGYGYGYGYESADRQSTAHKDEAFLNATRSRKSTTKPERSEQKPQQESTASAEPEAEQE